MTQAITAMSKTAASICTKDRTSGPQRRVASSAHLAAGRAETSDYALEVMRNLMRFARPRVSRSFNTRLSPVLASRSPSAGVSLE